MTPKAKLTEVATEQHIVFAFNPEKVAFRHTQRLTEYTGSKSGYDEYLQSQGIPKITVDGLTLYGPDTKAIHEQLEEWSRPNLATGDPNDPEAKPKLLEFSWGTEKTGVSFKAHLETVSVVYIRFDPVTAQPIRATVALAFHKVKPPIPKHNPTSGGPPGRRVHALDSSECLATVTMAAYGRPDAWRDVARANRITDPLRVRPGTEIFLPDFDELTNSDEPADDGSRS
jgi:hypothetical protein